MHHILLKFAIIFCQRSDCTLVRSQKSNVVLCIGKCMNKISPFFHIPTLLMLNRSVKDRNSDSASQQLKLNSIENNLL